MTWRTPSALKWLITKRSRLSGALLKLDDERAKLHDRICTLDRLSDVLLKKLAALDQTFGLHEIAMDPTAIQPVRPQTRARLLPRGQLGRIILTELRLADGWLSTSDMVARILSHLPEQDRHPLEPVRDCIRMRLGALVRKGLLERRNDGISAAGTHDGSSESYWRLASMRKPVT